MTPYHPDSPYKSLDGFTLIANIGKYCFPLLVKNESPWNTWQELINWARKNPRGIKVGLVGTQNVTTQGFFLSRVEEIEKIKFTYITFKNAPEITAALLGDHINLYGSTTDATIMSYIQDKKLRLLGFSDVTPKGFETSFTLKAHYSMETDPNLKGIFGPKGLSEPVLDRLEDAFAKAVKDPDFIKVMDWLVIHVDWMNKKEINRYVQTTSKETERIVRKLQAQQEKGKK
jgi:tripartite-type tricarboxylate transporter receptor subunit TctC